MGNIKSMCEKYYVYGCFIENILKYVGMGKGNRYKHCTSGKSSCSELNRDFHAGKNLVVEFFAKNISRVEALHLEAKLISENKESLYNKKEGLKSLESPNLKRTLNYKSPSFSEIEAKISSMANTITDEQISKVYEILVMAGLDFYLVESGNKSTMLVIDKFDEVEAEKVWYEAAGQYCDGDEIPGWRD